ncbi:ParB/RepB/Spo0J family plasmid partition protein [Citrobacter braakii]|nr:ParB/RepB/Spo0J family plasmid partition protein [Citrobacter braakii]
MKRTTMKNAPNLPKVSGQNSATATAPEPRHATPAAPVLGDLSRRLQGMKNNSITLPVCGRDVAFTLETVVPHMIDKATMVWAGNERDQGLLTQAALDDLIPSFLTSGQQNPAFGRKISGIIEIADGSRRRQTAIFTSSEYRVLVGELDDEQMAWLSEIGNDYRPTSAYERGKRYARRLENEFDGNVSKLAEDEGVDRKIITRCVNTARLPREIIGLFSHPGELSARAGDSLAKQYITNEDVMLSFAQHLANRKNKGELFETEQLIQQLHDIVGRPQKQTIRERVFSRGAIAKYRGENVIFTLNQSKLPSGLIEKIETLIEEHTESKSVAEKVNSQLSSIEVAVQAMQQAAKKAGINLSENNIKGHLPAAMKILNDHGTHKEKELALYNSIISHFG